MPKSDAHSRFSPLKALVDSAKSGMLACVALTSCEESGQVVVFRENFPPREAIPFSIPERRVRQIDIDPEAYRFLEAIGKMELQIADLEGNLDQVEELHTTYDFDAFLALDPWTVEKDSLLYLSHFCDAGYFTVQRVVLLSLLERKIAVNQSDPWTAPQGDGHKDLEQRLAEAMLNREERIMDLEHVLHVYDTRQGAGEFLIPDYIATEELEAMRADVAARLKRQRDLVIELDNAIQDLNVQFGAQ